MLRRRLQKKCIETLIPAQRSIPGTFESGDASSKHIHCLLSGKAVCHLARKARNGSDISPIELNELLILGRKKTDDSELTESESQHLDDILVDAVRDGMVEEKCQRNACSYCGELRIFATSALVKSLVESKVRNDSKLETKEYLEKETALSVDSVLKNLEAEDSNIANSSGIALVAGNIYLRKAIHDALGGQRQYGISTPSGSNLILLFSSVSGAMYGYNDGWRKDGMYSYTGGGQEGDMNLSRGNQAVVDSERNGKEIHFFEHVGSGKVRYEGRMQYYYHYFREQDFAGRKRKTVVFKLKPFVGT